jgi:hypothetical protein
MVNRDACRVNKNVTHRMFTHRLSPAKIGRDGSRHPHPVWPRDPSRSRGAEDQPGRGCGEVWVAPDVLQWRRARDQERVADEYREDRQRTENKTTRPVWPRLSGMDWDLVGP